MEIKIKISIHEINGNDVPINKPEELEIKSHWNRDEWVVLSIKGKDITVDASDLNKAVSKATDWRF